MIDHELTDNLVCPYCGHEHMDSWEISDGPSFYTCHECDKNFNYDTEITRTFTSSKADCRNGGEHDFKLIGGLEGYYPDFYVCRVCDARKNE